MKQLWEKLEAILQDIDPDLLADLAPRPLMRTSPR